MKPLCGICGDRHETYQGHRFATNKVATNTIATNGPATNADRKVGCSEVIEPDKVVGRSSSAGSRTANRRTREAYNAYQREWMRKDREKKRLGQH